MKNTFVKVLSLLMALTMIVGMFGAMTISASAHTHTKGEQVGEPVPATCASIGYTFYKCATCGETYPDDVVPMSKEHTGVVDVPAAEATCTYPAMTAGQYCEDCDTWVKDHEIAPVEGSNPVGHKFVGAHLGTYCQMIEYYVCAVCGLSYEDAKEADAKDDFLTSLKAEYDEIEWYEYDDKYAADVVRAQAHDWKYEVVKASTKCEDGATKRTCKTCGLVEEMVLRAPHDGFSVAYKSCEEYVGTKCGICGTPNPDDVAVNRTPNKHAWEVVTVFNTELQKLGYTSSTISKAATCTEAGYVLIYCPNCKQYAQNPIAALGHSWKANAVREDNKSDACMPGYTLYRECGRTGCGLKEVLNTVADRGHVWTESVVYPTCTTEGYTVRKCLNPLCQKVETYNYTEKLGHVWDEYVVLQGSYGDHTQDFIMTRYCVTCGVEDVNNRKVVVEATADGKCVYDTAISLSAATCTTQAFYIQACTIEGCTNYIAVDADGTPVVEQDRVYVGELNPANHDPASLTPKQNAVAATCTKEGSQLMYCLNCQVNVTVKFQKLAHKFVKGGVYDDKNDGNLSTAADKDFTYKPATCTKAGSTAGVLCVLCGTTKVAPKSIPVDPYNHVDKDGKAVTGTILATTEANCQNGGTTKTYYSCCDKTYTTYNTEADGSLKTTNPSNHINFTVYESKAAKCDVDGNHLYYVCDDCGALEIVQTITVGKKTYECKCGTVHGDTSTTPYVIPATGHTGVLAAMPGQYETCTEFGFTSYYKYVPAEEGETACGCEIGKKAIAPHGDTYVGKIYEVEATCTDYGFNVFKNDTTDAVYDAKVYVKDCLECFNKAGVDYEIIAPIGHSYVETTQSNATDCTAPAFNVKECVNCGDVYTLGYVAPKYTEHRFDIIKNAYTVKNDKLQFNGQWVSVTVEDGVIVAHTVVTEDQATPACCAPTYTYQSCVNSGCTKVIIVDGTYKAPVAHYSEETGEKVEITWSCTGFDVSLNMTCELCGQKVTAGSVTHKGEIIEKDVTCTENGYRMYVCVDCGKYLDVNGQIANDKDNNPDNDSISEVYPAPGHNPYDIDKDGKADYLKTGNIIANSIYAVNDTVDYVVDAKDATPYADGYIKYMCNNCQEVVEVVIPARNGITLNVTTDDVIANNGTFTVDVAVTANNFSFNSFITKVVYDYTAVKFEGATLTFAGFEAADAVTLVAKNNTISGYGVAAINVYVPNGADGLAKNAVISGDGVAFMTLTFSVLPTATAGFDADDNKLPVIYEVEVEDVKEVNEKGKLVAKEYDAAQVKVDYKALTLTNLADVNNDGRIDAGDSVAIMTLMYNKGTAVAADINGDGVVDLADHVAVLEFSLSFQTMVDYLAMMGITVEDLVADYNLKYDLDNDKDIDETDKAILAAVISEELAYYMVSYTEMADFLAACDCANFAELVNKAAYQFATTGVIDLIDNILA